MITGIEMRWIIVPAGSGRGLLDGAQTHETVLQFRTRTEGQYFEEKWSEWKDVTPPGR